MADFKVLVKMKNAYVIVKSLILFGHILNVTINMLIQENDSIILGDFLFKSSQI